MKNLIFFLSLVILSFASCQDTDIPQKPCEAENFGTLRITNNQDFRVDIFWDGEFVFSLAPSATNAKNVDTGTITVEAKSGANAWKTFVNIVPCKIENVSF